MNFDITCIMELKMKELKSHILLAAGLLFCSFIFYLIHYKVFHDPHHLFMFLTGDVAFVFIEVLMVTLIIERVIQRNEKRNRIEKLNMVIGAFFSEAGSHLLDSFSFSDCKRAVLHEQLLSEINSSRKIRNNSYASSHEYDIDLENINLDELKILLLEKHDFMLRMLENPNLMEHEKFSDLLWAVFHLAEELKSRDTLSGLPETDYRHLKGDIIRAYKLLSEQWVLYMEHLKENYPYLFSLALRTNPLCDNNNASVLE